MKSENQTDVPLFKGGCGHTDLEVEEAAVGCTIVTIVFIVSVVILFAFAYFFKEEL